MNYDELGDLREADWGALARDAPERPPDRRRPPAPTPASEERERLERRARADRRVSRIADQLESDTPEELARTLGLPLPVVREASDQLTLGRELRPELIHALGAQDRRRLPRSEVIEALGGEDCYEMICEEFAADALGRVAPPDRGSDVEPLTRTGEETLDYLGELAEADREHVA